MIIAAIVAGVAAVFLLTVLVGAPYVPTKRRDLESVFDELYLPTTHDTVLDIGSGDGIVLRRVAKTGARAVGYEINPFLVLISKWLSRHEPLVCVRLANFWRTPFPTNTTVVYVFGESRDIAKMASRVQVEAKRLKRPIKLISYGFEIPGKVAIKSSSAHHLYEFR